MIMTIFFPGSTYDATRGARNCVPDMAVVNSEGNHHNTCEQQVKVFGMSSRPGGMDSSLPEVSGGH